MAARKARVLSVKATRELLKLPWVRDDELSKHGLEARVLPDGRVLLVLSVMPEDDKGTLYPSREALRDLQRRSEAEAAKGPVDLTRTLLPPIDDFFRDVEAHAKSLGARIGVPDEVLDGTEASLEAVDKRVWRIPRAKRTTPELVTPLVAYIGEVMRRASDGRWSRSPTTRKTSVQVFEPSELAAWEAKRRAWWAAKKKALADALARGVSHHKASMEAEEATRQLSVDLTVNHPKPIRIDWVDEPITGHENEPMIRAANGALLQPYGIVIVEFERGGRGSLAGAVSGTLVAARPQGQPGGAGNQAAS